MDSQKMLQSNYLDLIFDGRNKGYGSYVLRAGYTIRMQKAGAFIFVLSLLCLIYSSWANSTKSLPVMPSLERIDTTLFTNVELDLPKDPVEPPAPPAQLNVKTELFIPPEIVANELVKPEESLATQDELKNAVAGTMKLSGDDAGDISIIIPEGRPGGSGSMLIETSSEPSKPFGVVEQMPEFPGGEEQMMAYMNRNIQFPVSALNANKQGKVLVRFVVNEDGSISDITTTRGFGFGSEAEAVRVVSGMPKWKPGRNNGKAVKVWFQLPVIFRLN